MILSLFQSKAERRRLREQEIRRGIMHIRRYIKTLNKNIIDYREKAVEAKRIGATDQLTMITNAIKRSLLQVRTQERQLLAIETAIQLKNQAESMSQFAKSMQAVSTSIAEDFSDADLNQTISQYEQAITQAEDMHAAMDVFLDTTSDMLDANATDERLVSDTEIQQMLEEDYQQSSLLEIGGQIDEVLKRQQKASS